jgi:hypothetical protein
MKIKKKAAGTTAFFLHKILLLVDDKSFTYSGLFVIQMNNKDSIG